MPIDSIIIRPTITCTKIVTAQDDHDKISRLPITGCFSLELSRPVRKVGHSRVAVGNQGPV